jgi:hypothetical protein
MNRRAFFFLPLAAIPAAARGAEPADIIRVRIQADIDLAHYEGTARLERIKNTKAPAPEKPC